MVIIRLTGLRKTELTKKKEPDLFADSGKGFNSLDGKSPVSNHTDDDFL